MKYQGDLTKNITQTTPLGIEIKVLFPLMMQGYFLSYRKPLEFYYSNLKQYGKAFHSDKYYNVGVELHLKFWSIIASATVKHKNNTTHTLIASELS